MNVAFQQFLSKMELLFHCKKLKDVCAAMKPKSNGLRLHWNYLLSSVASDGKDGNGFTRPPGGGGY